MDYVFAEKDNEVIDLVGCSLFQAEGDEPFYTLCGLVERAAQLGIKYESILDLLPGEVRKKYEKL